MKMNIVDAQNACLSGGVAVGAIADLVLQPYGVLIIGSVAGMISTIGYQLIQNWLQNVLNLHDSCGVHNLHGMPGIFSSLLSALFSGLASEEIYGVKLYQYFPNLTPDGVSYTAVDQVYAQLMTLGITLALAIGGGILTGTGCPNKFGNMFRSSEKFASEASIDYEKLYFAPKNCFLSLFCQLQK